MKTINSCEIWKYYIVVEVSIVIFNMYGVHSPSIVNHHSFTFQGDNGTYLD